MRFSKRNSLKFLTTPFSHDTILEDSSQLDGSAMLTINIKIQNIRYKKFKEERGIDNRSNLLKLPKGRFKSGTTGRGWWREIRRGG